MLNCKFIKEYVKGYFGRLRENEKGQSFTELVILVAVGLVVAAFVMVPGLRNFADTVLDGLSNWWTSSISSKIFPTT